MIDPVEEVCIIDKFQRKGKTFPLNIAKPKENAQYFALMDTGVYRSCINYNTFRKLNNVELLNKGTPKVVGADGGDLGSMGSTHLTLLLGDRVVQQEFIVCRQLCRNMTLGVDFARKNCAGVSWTTQHTRILSLNGIPPVEVEEDELGMPVTAAYHVKLPPRYNGVFQVNIHGKTNGTHVISTNRHLLEKHPNMYQHEIAIVSENQENPFPIIAITNLDQVKTLHINKGDIVGFATPESPNITTTNELNIQEPWNMAPKHWIPKRKQDSCFKSIKHSKQSQRENHRGYAASKEKEELGDPCMSQIECIEHSIHSQRERCVKGEDEQ